MDARYYARIWLDACKRLVAYDRVPGYRRLSWWDRKGIEHAAFVKLLSAPSFWRAFFWVGVATALMYIVSWERDLVGAPRDLLRALPLSASFPALVAARRKNLRLLLLNRDADHGQASTNASQ